LPLIANSKVSCQCSVFRGKEIAALGRVKLGFARNDVKIKNI